MSKAYGLIIPGQQKKEKVLPPTNAPKPSIFDEDSSESSEEDLPKVRGKFNAPNIGPGALERRQARTIQQKALAEDPTIFQYDELYDEIETKRDEEKKLKSSEEKKPKYIGRLLQQAERRKLENERRIERQVQKEREAEGEMFKDKESFVTSAYKKKLEELKIAEEAEKREDYLESIGDVTKQGNLDGFYRHLYEQKLGPKDQKPNIISKDNENSDNLTKIKDAKTRTYRKRQSSGDEDENEKDESVVPLKKAHIQSNLDADSDFSIDDTSSEEECDKNEKPRSSDIPTKLVQIKVENNGNLEIEKPIQEQKVEIDISDGNKVKEEMEVSTEDGKEPEAKVKINIWEKRTIGDVFDAALQKYYERKNSKMR